MTDDPNGSRFALYQHAHHDLWWAKTQQWSVANWALLAIAALVGLGRTLVPNVELRHTWSFIALIAIVGIAAGWYLSHLHSDIVHNRKVYRQLESETGIAELRTTLPQRAGEATDLTRGLGILFVMAGAIAFATGFAVLLLGGSASLSLAVGGGVAVTDWVLLRRAA